jgi:hypothetical protein
MATIRPAPTVGRVGQHLKVALIAWTALSLVLVIVFPKGTWPFALFIAAVPVGLILNEVVRPRGAQRFQLKGYPPFNASIASHTMAIDTDTDRLWVCDRQGRRYVFDKSELAEWTHRWTVNRNFWGRSFYRENRIELRTRNLQVPSVIVPFGRYRDWTGANKNYAMAVEWTDRLSVFVNG